MWFVGVVHLLVPQWERGAWFACAAPPPPAEEERALSVESSLVRL